MADVRIFFFIFSFLHALPFTLSADKFFLYVRHFPFGCMKWMSDWADSCAFEMGVRFLSCISLYFFFFFFFSFLSSFCSCDSSFFSSIGNQSLFLIPSTMFIHLIPSEATRLWLLCSSIALHLVYTYSVHSRTMSQSFNGMRYSANHGSLPHGPYCN